MSDYFERARGEVAQTLRTLMSLCAEDRPDVTIACSVALDELARLQIRVAELEAGPRMMVQEFTGKWHAFADGCDPRIDSAPTNPGYYSRASVQEWIWYSKIGEQPEQEEKP